MLFNFAVDFLLLYGTSQFSEFPVQPKRIIASSFLGAMYSGMCLIKGFRFLSGWYWRVIFMLIMCIQAFGFKRATIQQCGIFLLLSFSAGGIWLTIFKNSFMSLIGCIICFTVFLTIIKGLKNDLKEYITIEIFNGKNSVKLVALRDTGNTLRDPVSGEEVLVIGDGEAQKLTGLTPNELCMPLETISNNKIPGLRLIPYRSVGKSSGMLLGKRFPDVRFNGRIRSTIVAFSPNCIGNNMYQALVGGNMR